MLRACQLFLIALIVNYADSVIWVRKKQTQSVLQEFKVGSEYSDLQIKITFSDHSDPLSYFCNCVILALIGCLQQIELFSNGETINGKSMILTASDCDLEKSLGEIICPRVPDLFPVGLYHNITECMLFSGWGSRLNSCYDMNAGLSTESLLHISNGYSDEKVYIVPSNRLFMWPTHQVGHVVEINHVPTPFNEPIKLETISTRPRVFRVHNLFSSQEADALIQEAMQKRGEEKLQRSYIGTDYETTEFRTSDNSYDSTSPIASALKRRALELLGIYPYDDRLADGLQISRYAQTQAYSAHHDYIEVTKARMQQHNYDSSIDGTNRYATIVFYLNDVDIGGETCFNSMHPKSFFLTRRMARKSAYNYLVESGLLELYRDHHWVRELFSECRSRLSIKPQRLEALLFYNQEPNGIKDMLALHSGCPVIRGVKWVASLWVWNGPRNGYWKIDENTGDFIKPSVEYVSASFESKNVVGAALYWFDQLWEEMVVGRTVKVNTYPGHVWSVKIPGEKRPVKVWNITNEKSTQRYVLTSDDLPIFT